MLKKDVVIEIIKKAGIEGLDTVKAIKEFENTVERVFDVIGEGLEVDDKAKFAGFTTAKKIQKGREGVSKLGGQEKPWKTEDKVVVKTSR